MRERRYFNGSNSNDQPEPETKDLPVVIDQTQRENWRDPNWKNRKNLSLDGTSTQSQRQAIELMNGALRNSDKLIKSVTKAKLNEAELEKLKTKKANKLSGLNQAYGRMMLSGCIGPLQNGLNPRSLASSMIMAGTLYALSPVFRDQTKDLGNTAYAKVKEYSVGRKIDQINKRNALYKAMNEGETLSKREMRYLRNMQKRDGSNMPFTEESAGATRVGITLNFRKQILDVQDDPELDADVKLQKIRILEQRHDAFQDELDARLIDEGLNMAGVDRVSRQIVEEQLEVNPDIAIVFKETAYGEYGLDGDGDMVNRMGEKPVKGYYSMRKIGELTPQDEVDLVSLSMYGDLERTLSKGDLEGFNRKMLVYGVALGAKDKDIDLSGADPNVRADFNRARTMVRSLSADNVDMDDMRQGYSDCFVSVLSYLGDQHPDLAEEWRKQYGDDWENQMKAFSYDPEATMRHWHEHGRSTPNKDMPKWDKTTKERHQQAWKAEHMNREYANEGDPIDPDFATQPEEPESENNDNKEYGV